MKNQVVFATPAYDEITSSYHWYEQKQSQLGKRFLSAIDTAVETITNNPEAYPIKVDSYREFVVAIFPFVLIYEYVSAQNTIYILHVFHTSRNPNDKR